MVGFHSIATQRAASTPLPGAGTLLFNTADNNTAIGAGALLSNATGYQNTANGAFALFGNTTGFQNTATGANALFNNTTGSGNVANGINALFSNTTGGINTAIGYQALFSNPTGVSNTATGVNVLFNNTNGSSNTASGDGALFYNTEGNVNTANGVQALNSNTTGNANTANGYQALFHNITGINNTAVGSYALGNNTSGIVNVALGSGAGSGVTTASGVICIGISGANVSDSCYIGNIWNQPGGSQAVYVNSEGKLGAQVSSRRFKDEIKPMEQSSQVIYGLKPVSFRYKPEIEPTRPVGFGLIAEDVEKISADLVTRGGDGKVNSVRHDAVNAMLLNEFLKEHRKVEKLEAAVADLATTVKEQAAHLQRVSAQVDNSVSRVAVANR